MSAGPTDAPVVPSPDPGAPTGTTTTPQVLRRDVAAVLGSYLVLGIVGGILWWLLVDPAEFTKADNGALAMGEVELAERFNDDGWFAVIAGVVGLLSGAGVVWWRSRDPLLTVALVLVGSTLAAAVMAFLGQLLGPADPDSVVAAAEVGAMIPMQLEVTGFVCYLVWPLTALAGALLVLWSPAPDTAPDIVSRAGA